MMAFYAVKHHNISISKLNYWHGNHIQPVLVVMVGLKLSKI